MKKLDKNAIWWGHEEKDWSYQDKNGDFWILRDKEGKEKKDMNPCLNPISNLDTEKLDLLASVLSWRFIALIICSGALGVSIAINVFQYLYIESIT